MTVDIFTLLEVEEGWSDTPYVCSEGYPTVGYGFKLGPKLTNKNNIQMYAFTLPREAGNVWLQQFLNRLLGQMTLSPLIKDALTTVTLTQVPIYNNARACVLISMAYQMGVDGLAKFRKFLSACAAGKWDVAVQEMADSAWAKQTPNRFKRHAEQIRTGQWQPEYRK